jgi:CheY-like chemotaxis protein
MPTRRPLILIVDDDARIRELYCTLLRKHFRVAEAEDGHIGVTQAQELRPDLILTDQTMAGCSGLEMVRRIREIPGLCSVRVVVSSGFMSPQLEKDFAAAGVRHFLNKPCRWQDLVRIVEGSLNQAESQGA